MPEPTLTVLELATRLASTTPPYVLDVREDAEWARSHITNPHVHHMPMARLEDTLENLPQDRPIAVLCRVGGRSARVTAFLNALGYQAVNVAGGMLAWVETVDPSLPQP